MIFSSFHPPPPHPIATRQRPVIVSFRSFDYDDQQFKTLKGREQQKYAPPSEPQLKHLQGTAYSVDKNATDF
jgi:hypothetical protein